MCSGLYGIEFLELGLCYLMVHLVSFCDIFLSGHITSDLLFLDQMYLFIKSVEAQGP